MSNCSTYLISIHAAREGGDPRPRQPQGKRSISIHAAREGGDDDGYAKDIAQGVFQSTPPVKAATDYRMRNGLSLEFQSTPPVKAATIHGTCQSTEVPSFQSTPPVKAATNSRHMSTPFLLFQSTPPVKAATERNEEHQPEGDISIHAAREGGDPASSAVCACESYFNPRRP